MRIRRFCPSVLKAFVTHRPVAARPDRLLIALLLLLPLPAAPQATPDQVVIQAGTHVVLVNVVVKDKHGKPVDDLSRDDFALRDNGREQQITLFALEKAVETLPAAVSSSPAGMTFTIPLNFTEDRFHDIQEKGLIMSTRVKTRPETKGFSLGFRDVPSGMVGTLHVPL